MEIPKENGKSRPLSIYCYEDKLVQEVLKELLEAVFEFELQFYDEMMGFRPNREHFIGFPGYQEAHPFDASTLVLFRKCITINMLMEVNEYILAKKEGHEQPLSSGSSGGSCDPETEPENKGTLTLDVTCAPAHIRYPRDISLLNEAREFLEDTIWRFCKFYGLPLPRCYKRQARKAYLTFA